MIDRPSSFGDVDPPEPKHTHGVDDASDYAPVDLSASDLDPYVPPLPLGTRLRLAREERNLSLEEMAAQTRIRRTYLQCIEEGRLEGLPGAAYAAGFIRTYAQMLDVTDDSLEGYTDLKEEPTVASQHLTFPLPQPPKHGLGWALIALAVVLFVAVLTMWGTVQETWREQTQALLPHWFNLQEAASLVMPLQPSSEPQITVSAAAHGWLQLRDRDDSLITTRVLEPGDVYSYIFEQGLILTVSDPTAMQVMVKGREVPLTGIAGQISRNISLDDF